MPRLGLLTMRHQLAPVSLDKATDVLIPTEEATPTTTPTNDEVIQRQVGHMHPVEGHYVMVAIIAHVIRICDEQ